MHQESKDSGQRTSKDDIRKLWVEAVESMAENAALKARIEFLEQQLFVNAYTGWRTH